MKIEVFRNFVNVKSFKTIPMISLLNIHLWNHMHKTYIEPDWKPFFSFSSYYLDDNNFTSLYWYFSLNFMPFDFLSFWQQWRHIIYSKHCVQMHVCSTLHKEMTHTDEHSMIIVYFVGFVYSNHSPGSNFGMFDCCSWMRIISECD